MTQPTQENTGPAARASDPSTSHMAAAAAARFAIDHKERISAALRKHGPMGKDAIGRACGLDGVSVARRLAELARMRMIRLTGKKVSSDRGSPEREWEAAP